MSDTFYLLAIVNRTSLIMRDADQFHRHLRQFFIPTNQYIIHHILTNFGLARCCGFSSLQLTTTCDVTNLISFTLELLQIIICERHGKSFKCKNYFD